MMVRMKTLFSDGYEFLSLHSHKAYTCDYPQAIRGNNAKY